MNIQNRLLVSINGGNYQELFSSLNEKVKIEFLAQDQDKEPALSITLSNGNSLKFKYVKQKEEPAY